MTQGPLGTQGYLAGGSYISGAEFSAHYRLSHPGGPVVSSRPQEKVHDMSRPEQPIWFGVPSLKGWSRSFARVIAPRKHLRVLPTRTRPSLFGGD